jgi:hypothetical protein
MGLNDLGPGVVVVLVELLNGVSLGFFHIDLLTVELHLVNFKGCIDLLVYLAGW